MPEEMQNNQGLSDREVENRIAEGKRNVLPASKSKTTAQIVRDNTLTLFNLLNIILAIAVIAVGSYKNALFINIIIINTIIGTIQEIKAKQVVDQLSILSQPKVLALRNGQPMEIGIEDIVLDDVLFLSPGKQIPSDGAVLDGSFEVNESLLTGEADAVIKNYGDDLKSGSYIISGKGKMRVEAVGNDNYASRIINKVMRPKQPNSEIMKALNFIMKCVGITIVPIGILLLLRQTISLYMPLNEAIVSTVAALIGMIPQGLVLLTSVALAVGVLRLAKQKTLIQELYCIETLSRVDMLCLDKTGTLTEGCMEVTCIEPVSRGKDPIKALRALVHVLDDDNTTATAIKSSLKGEVPKWKVGETVCFSSERKWSGVNFMEKGTYIMGAPEFVLQNKYELYQEKIEAYAKEGNRVLVLAHSSDGFKSEGQLPDHLETVAIIRLADKIRPEARSTLKYFADQGVEIKIISGDNPVTVSEVACRAGLRDGANYVDASTLEDDQAVREAALRHTVFGRVSPVQKKLLIQTLKEDGHTVGMVGDGVNDVLALREADCSIAMAKGSDVTKQISQVVLLDSNFSHMTEVLMEGRRVTNNICRAASLFLVKTVFSFLLAILTIIFAGKYPFQPIQLTLFSATCIGIPSFFLALEPNKARVTGNFLAKVIKKAVPGAVAMVIMVASLLIIGDRLQLSGAEISTMACILMGTAGLIILFGVCLPMNFMRISLFMTMAIFYYFAVIVFPEFFSLLPMYAFERRLLLILLPMILLFYPVKRLVQLVVDKIEVIVSEKRHFELEQARGTPGGKSAAESYMWMRQKK